MPGIRQRLSMWENDANEPAGPANVRVEQSALVTRLLLQYTSGQISAVSVQKLAHAAVVDGITHQEVWSVAAIGNWGEYPGNCNRDLRKLIGCDDSLPEPSECHALTPKHLHRLSCMMM